MLPNLPFHLQLIGYSMILLALVHFTFPRRFNWKGELVSLGLLNRQVFKVHTFFIAFTVFCMGLLCVTSYDLLMTTELGRRVAIGLMVFWGIRLFAQFFIYSSELWRGKKFETFMHVVFGLTWLYYTLAFAEIVFSLGS